MIVLIRKRYSPILLIRREGPNRNLTTVVCTTSIMNFRFRRVYRQLSVVLVLLYVVACTLYRVVSSRQIVTTYISVQLSVRYGSSGRTAVLTTVVMYRKTSKYSGGEERDA